MSTLRYQVMQAVATALSSASASKFEQLDDALASSAVPALIYGWRSDEVEDMGMLDKHMLTIAVQAYTRGASADSGADTLIGQAYGLLTADRSLGGKVKRMNIGPAERESTQEGGKGVLITQFLTLEYLAERGSLTVAA